MAVQTRGGKGWRYPEAVSQADVGEVVPTRSGGGAGRSYVQKLTAQGMPRNTDGSYDLRAVVGWLVQEAEKRGRNAAMSELEGLGAGVSSPALERKRTAEAMEKEVDLAVKCGALCSVESAEGQFVRAVAVWDERMAVMPQRCLGIAKKGGAGMLAGFVALRDEVMNQVREVLLGVDEGEEGLFLGGVEEWEEGAKAAVVDAAVVAVPGAAAGLVDLVEGVKAKGKGKQAGKVAAAKSPAGKVKKKAKAAVKAKGRTR